MANRSAVSKRVLDLIWKRDEGLCRYCGKDAGTDFEIDHVKPHSKGGADTISNLVLSCRPCNRKKGDEDWTKKLLPTPVENREDDLNVRLSALEAAMEAQKVELRKVAIPPINFAKSRSQSQFEEDIRRKAAQPQFGEYDDD